MKPVLTKKDFVKRYAEGEFGNRSPTWDSLDEMEENNVLEYATNETLYHLRNKVTGGDTYYNVKPEDLVDRWYEVCKKQGSDTFYVSEMAPTHLTLIQGEIAVLAGYQNPVLRYTRVRKPMREALAMNQAHVYGLTALCYLRQFLCNRSYDHLRGLLDAYPDHVIEFSTYATDWGTVPGVNTIIWEVRKY